MNQAQIKELQNRQKEVNAAIETLATQFQDMMKNSTLDINNPMQSSFQKLQLDINTMIIDQNVRKLLVIIRLLKEFRITDNSYQEDRQEFENQCFGAIETVKQCVKESYDQLTALSQEGFAVRQAASKFLH